MSTTTQKQKGPASASTLPSRGSIKSPEGKSSMNVHSDTTTDAKAEAALARRHAFDKLFSEWLTSRAILASGGDDTTLDRAIFREGDLARLITTTPVPYAAGVFHKLEVLRHYLIETTYTDNRPIVLLAGIEADLRRLEISDRGSSI